MTKVLPLTKTKVAILPKVLRTRRAKLPTAKLLNPIQVRSRAILIIKVNKANTHPNSRNTVVLAVLAVPPNTLTPRNSRLVKGLLDLMSSLLREPKANVVSGPSR